MKHLDLNLPEKPGLFITATDTEVGKTLIAGAIADVLKRKGLTPGVFKPIASGCRREREGLVSADAEFLSYCADSRFPLDIINPVSYAAPLAPAVCEHIENKPVDFESIASAYTHICENCDVVIVEGLGGILAPISENTRVLELAVEFAMPAVIVARPGLGTINHTLMTIETLRFAGIPVAGVIINGYRTDTAGTAEETNPQMIEEFGCTEVLTVIGYDEQSSVEDMVLGDAVTLCLEDIPWQSLAGMR